MDENLIALRYAIELCGYRHAEAAYRAWARAGQPDPKTFFKSMADKVYLARFSR